MNRGTGPAVKRIALPRLLEPFGIGRAAAVCPGQKRSEGASFGVHCHQAVHGGAEGYGQNLFRLDLRFAKQLSDPIQYAVRHTVRVLLGNARCRRIERIKHRVRGVYDAFRVHEERFDAGGPHIRCDHIAFPFVHDCPFPIGVCFTFFSPS
ncbi:hypothetical protein D3C73_1359470 [compost metagenome]